MGINVRSGFSSLAVAVIGFLAMQGQAAASRINAEELKRESRLFHPPSECVAQVNELHDLLAEYSREGELNSWWSVPRLQKKIQARLHGAEGSSCFTALSQAYAIDTAMIVGRDGLQQDIANALSVLAETKLLIPITPAMRENTGGIWRKDVLGAYDCATTRIYFEPFQPPANLGVTLIHELDHLFRDKLYDVEKAGLEMRRAILLDEAMASLHAAYTGLRLTTDIWVRRRLTDFPYFPPFNKPTKTINPFSMKTDNSLYSKQGNLYKIWKAVPLDGGGFKHALWFVRFVWQTLIDFRMEDEYANLFRIVDQTYFREPAPEVSSLVGVVKSALVEIEPMERWLREHQGYYYGDPEQRTRTMLELSDPKGIMRRKSRSCELFEASLRKGELDDYIGKGTEGSGKPGSEGVRPGSEGVRPSLTTKPCLHPSDKL